MPVLGAFLQSLVIAVLAVSDQAFNTNILSDWVTRAVQEQQGQQAAHASVAVVERVDAEKVQNEHGDQQQIVQLRIGDGFIDRRAERIHSLRCLPCRNRYEACASRSIRERLGDNVVRVLEAPADGHAAEFVQIPVELEDHTGANWDKLIVFVDCVQHIPVSGDLALAAAARRGFVPHDQFQAIVGCDDAFDPVRRLRALDLRDLQQFLKHVLLSIGEPALFSLLLVDLCEIGNNFRCQKLLIFLFIVKNPHVHSSFDRPIVSMQIRFYYIIHRIKRQVNLIKLGVYD